jgi:hypothetical protein
MSDGEEVTLLVNEERVAEKPVAITAGGRGLVQLLHNRAESGGERSFVTRFVWSRGRQENHGAERSQERESRELR